MLDHFKIFTYENFVIVDIRLSYIQIEIYNYLLELFEKGAIVLASTAEKEKWRGFLCPSPVILASFLSVYFCRF